MKVRLTQRVQRSRANRRGNTKLQSRRPHLESLEGRRLMAADVGGLDNRELVEPPAIVSLDSPEDVNGDGDVTAMDALMLINAMSRQSRGGVDGEANGIGPRGDVNGDGRITAADALRVINRMRDNGQGRGGDRPDDIRGENDSDDSDGNGTDPDVVLFEVRSIDGTGNHLQNPELGSAGTQFVRVVDSDYADGVDEPAGADRASAREISNLVAAQEESIDNERGLSSLIWVWGQFIDHDLDLTAEGHDESFDIEVPTGDPLFDPFASGEASISLTRSAAAEGTGIGTDVAREHTNEITSFLDGSMVYGSDQETADGLRTFSAGQLATSEGDLLPIGEDGFFQAGDVRANENVALTSMHTLWVREHNRVAAELAAQDDSLSDEELYQTARAIVIGELQAITFNEYLPALLGRDAISTYDGYDSTVDPSISNLFATAAYRYGHTTLTSTLPRLDDDGNEIEAGSLELQNAFFSPDEVAEHGIESLLKGLSSQTAQEVDTMLIDDVRNFLFGPPGAGGFDLAALNIQRGRDHGLPDYNSVREQLGLERVESFADISSDAEVQSRLEAAYGTVDDIDVWVGSLAEDHVEGASVGQLLQTVMVDQFEAIRDGDRFWYQNTFEGEALREISQTRLSDVIERNTTLTSIQNNAFFSDPSTDGPQDGNRDRDQTRNERVSNERPRDEQQRNELPARPTDRDAERPSPSSRPAAIDEFFGQLGRGRLF